MKTLKTVILALITFSFVFSSCENKDAPPSYVPGDYQGQEGVKIDGLWWAPVNVGYTTANPYGLLFNWGKNVGFEYQGDDLTTGGQSATNGSWEVQDQGPCPDGWRVPTEAELTNLLTAVNSPVDTDGVPGKWRDASAENPNGLAGRWFGPDCKTATVTTPGKSIFFPAAGYWYSSDSKFTHRGTDGFYWSSNSGRRMIFHSRGANMNRYNVSRGLSLRCVQN